MAHEVELLYKDMKHPYWFKNAEIFILRVLDRLAYRDWSFSVTFCSDKYMRSLNRDYRGKDGATDVLSFPQIQGKFELPETGRFFAGDIVISLESLKENARYFNVEEEEELKRLLIHGILHLGGWDHSDNSPEQEMLQSQENILGDLQKEKIY